MKINDDFDFSRYDVNVQEFSENVRHILNYGLYDHKYISELVPTWKPTTGEHPIIISKVGAIGRLFIGDSSLDSGWWFVDLTELPVA